MIPLFEDGPEAWKMKNYGASGIVSPRVQALVSTQVKRFVFLRLGRPMCGDGSASPGRLSVKGARLGLARRGSRRSLSPKIKGLRAGRAEPVRTSGGRAAENK
ncbi:MAG: hypothetical protein JSS81_15575 [Acidobacteria bacterium]|nr:hypothetical protein [Acidobacteriota bacterium]